LERPLIILAPGGLGNQLFSIAAALHLSERSSSTIWVLSDYLELVNKFNVINCDNGNAIKVKVVYSRKLNLWLNKNSSRILIIARRISRLENFFAPRFRTVQNPWEFPFDLLEVTAKIPWVLRGFFQDIRLIQKLSEKNRNFLASLFDVEIDQRNSADRLSPKIIGVHIRRGDYKLIPSYGTLSLSYFQKILSHVQNLDSSLFIASDEANILRHVEFSGNVNLLFPQEISPIETITLLAKSDLFLMSNSTFSFWIAWCVHLRGGIVYIPSPWFKEIGVPDGFLCLDNFIKVKAVFE
jgi:hypothetical protein